MVSAFLPTTKGPAAIASASVALAAANFGGCVVATEPAASSPRADSTAARSPAGEVEMAWGDVVRDSGDMRWHTEFEVRGDEVLADGTVRGASGSASSDRLDGDRAWALDVSCAKSLGQDDEGRAGFRFGGPTTLSEGRDRPYIVIEIWDAGGTDGEGDTLSAGAFQHGDDLCTNNTGSSVDAVVEGRLVVETERASSPRAESSTARSPAGQAEMAWGDVVRDSGDMRWHTEFEVRGDEMLADGTVRGASGSASSDRLDGDRAWALDVSCAKSLGQDDEGRAGFRFGGPTTLSEGRDRPYIVIEIWDAGGPDGEGDTLSAGAFQHGDDLCTNNTGSSVDAVVEGDLVVGR